MKFPNIVWFMIDSLRPDFIPKLGAQGEPTFIDDLLSRGTTFTNCITAAPYTIGSENSLFTSFYPHIHGVDGHFKNSPEDLKEGIVTLTDILKGGGYSNFCYYPGIYRPYIPPYGFDRYSLVQGTDNYNLKPYQKCGTPKFLFFDFEEVHDACVKNRKKHTKQLAHGSYVKVSTKVESFYHDVCEEDDIIIISSDHGIRVCDDRGAPEHRHEDVTGEHLTDKTIKTVFSIIWPGQIARDRQIDSMVRTIDIAPTLLELLGLPLLKAQGQSLVPHLRGDKSLETPPAFLMTGSMAASPWGPDTWGIRTKDWKYVLKKKKGSEEEQEELYDLAGDPAETENIVMQEKEKAQELRESLDQEFFQNKRLPVDYYQEQKFDYESHLAKRYYPFAMKVRMFIYTQIIYKLYWRLAFRVSRLVKKIGLLRP